MGVLPGLDRDDDERDDRPRASRARSRLLRGALLVSVLVGVLVAAWFGLRGAVNPLRTAGCEATVDGRTVDIDVVQMQNAATITGIAVRRRLPARAATIAIATAIQESKLVNVDYGDRDSLGLFQQRPSQGWGTPAQVRDPVYATNKFYDALVKIDGYRSMEITKVAQQVQRSAYPEAYADHEPDARVLASALTGHSAAAVRCTLDEDVAVAGPAGFTPFAKALRAELTTAKPARLAGSAGVRIPAADATTTWAVAHWSAAQAQRLGVARVYAGGRVWSRTTPDGGWQAATGVPAGSGVVVMFTDAAPPTS